MSCAKNAVMSAFCGKDVDPSALTRSSPGAARFGFLPGGIYRITDKVVADIRAGRVQTMHPSLLGP